VRGVLFRFLVCAVIATPATALAGRTFYGWLYGTDVLPERGVELGTWVQEENGQPTNPVDETRWWEAVEVGITDQLEVVFPIEIAWDEVGLVTGTPPKLTTDKFTSLDRFGVDVRYRLVTSDPVNAPALVPLVRVSVMQDIANPGGFIMEGDAVVDYNVGRFQAAIDLGANGEAGAGANTNTFVFHPAAGVSIEAVHQLRFGAEVYSEITLDPSAGGYWLVAGPNMAWTPGRFWLSGSYGIGLHGIRDAPRVQWGVAF
jgi:hypothetical protein